MSNSVEILKHGRNYLIANLSTKALAFISIPLYTRLLSPNEYGITSIFLGVAGIISPLINLSTDRSVSRYYFDQNNIEDFKRFTGTSSILSIIFFILNSFILIVFAQEFGNLVGVNKYVVYLIIPFSLVNMVGLLFEQIYSPMKKSKEIALSSTYRVLLGFVCSVIFIVLFYNDKYYALIFGQIIAGIILCFYWFRKISPYFILSFRKEYFKYIFTYSVPLIPYALSGVLIAQFGKIVIGRSQSISEAGFYSLALSVSSLAGIAIEIAHSAWNPYYFEYMNSKNYKQLDRDFIRIFKISILVAFAVAAFGKEIGLLLSKKEFTGSLYLIPIFTIGYVFYQLAYAYLRNFGYSRSTHYMTICVLISGLSNVLLNFILIKYFGELGSAVAFVLSYIIMALLGWVINKFIVKLHATPLHLMLFPLLIALPFYSFLYFIINIDSLVVSVMIKAILLFLLTTSIMWIDRKEIIALLKKIRMDQQ